MTAAQSVQSRPLTVAAAAMAVLPSDDLIDHTRAKYAYPWWLSDDPYVIAERQLREPVLLVEFSKLRDCVGLVLGRIVEPFEFTDPEKLMAEIEALMS